MRASLALFVLLAGCNCSDPRVDDDGGILPGADAGKMEDAETDDVCVNGAARWIYAVDSDRTFLRFEPDSRTLTALGTLSCPSGAATPFSMAVDRDANAWVLHNDGRIYLVDIENGLACTQSSF